MTLWDCRGSMDIPWTDDGAKTPGKGPSVKCFPDALLTQNSDENGHRFHSVVVGRQEKPL